MIRAFIVFLAWLFIAGFQMFVWALLFALVYALSTHGMPL